MPELPEPGTQILLTVVCVYLWFQVRWDFRPERAPRAHLEAETRIPPEWSLAAALTNTVLALLLWAGYFVSTGVVSNESLVGTAVALLLATGVFVWFPILFFDRPRFLIPAWRRAELDAERRARRVRAKQLEQ